MKHANLFVDEVEIEVHSGRGGDGVVGFRREKFVSMGGPNGGDGGRGGDIVLVADENVGTLLDFKGAKKIKAPRGANGGSSDRKGASGEHVEVRVPVGTLVFELGAIEPDTTQDVDMDMDMDMEEDDEGVDEHLIEQEASDVGEPEVLADLIEDGQRVVVARGGKGGLGNARFKTSTRQAPDFALPGKPGESRRLRLSLKLMADVGLVGFPNAGKSTLLRRISAARPRVANYPFTTLVPSLGVVERDDQRIVVADIPGLIEGASDGAGLGHQFLRHVERTRVLVHVVDLFGEDPVGAYRAIRKELDAYGHGLAERPEIVVANKIDQGDPGPLLKDLAAEVDTEVVPISGVSGAGLPALVERIAALL